MSTRNPPLNGSAARFMRASRVPAASDHGRLDALAAISRDGFNSPRKRIFGLTHTPDCSNSKMRAHGDQMKDWLLHGTIEADEKMAADLAGPRYHINRSNLLVLESKADMQKRAAKPRPMTATHWR
jgi:hypothetical protein